MAKKITVKTTKKDEKVAEMMHFGYRAIDFNEKGNKTTITFGRDLSADDKTLKEIEKEYHIISSPFPTVGFIFLLLGAAFIVSYFTVLNNSFTTEFIMSIIRFAALLLGILSTGTGLFFVAVFALMKVFRKQLVEKLFLKGDRYQGIVRDFPVSKNVEPVNELSGILKHNIKDIVISK